MRKLRDECKSCNLDIILDKTKYIAISGDVGDLDIQGGYIKCSEEFKYLGCILVDAQIVNRI